jgi:hypothetical protein
MISARACNLFTCALYTVLPCVYLWLDGTRSRTKNTVSAYLVSLLPFDSNESQQSNFKFVLIPPKSIETYPWRLER